MTPTVADPATTSEYEMTWVRPEHTAEVVDLLRVLVSGDGECRRAYYEWKYIDNPHADQPLGVVALHRGTVVGFRGYFATRWSVDDAAKSNVVLIPGDTCVDHAHRRRGLSLAMGDFAGRELAGRFPVFLNLTCTKNSYPGYLRLGFVPLVPKTSLDHYGLLGLLRTLRGAKAKAPLQEAGIPFGRCGDVVVSDRPWPSEMAAIISTQSRTQRTLRLCQDEAFFSWRFRNRVNKYVFYYLIEDGSTTGYVVLGVSPSNRRGYVLDCAGMDDVVPAHLFRFLIRARHFAVVSISEYSARGSLLTTVSRLGLRPRGLLRFIERRVHGVYPLLVRPVVPGPLEKDWFLEGLDIRKPDSWTFKGICSDAA